LPAVANCPFPATMVRRPVSMLALLPALVLQESAVPLFGESGGSAVVRNRRFWCTLWSGSVVRSAVSLFAESGGFAGHALTEARRVTGANHEIESGGLPPSPDQLPPVLSFGWIAASSTLRHVWAPEIAPAEPISAAAEPTSAAAQSRRIAPDAYVDCV